MCFGPSAGYVDARPNNSKPTDITGCPITFVLSGCGNNNIQIHTKLGEDHGCGGKIHEISTCFNLLADRDPHNPSQRKCDTSMPSLSRTGPFDGEIFYWARAMFKTITSDVCRQRHMTPLPPSVRASQEELANTSLAEKVREWLKDHTLECSREDATDWNVLKTVIEDALGKMDTPIWSEAGIAPKMQGRYRSKKNGIDKFFVFFPNDEGVRAPRKIHFG